MCKDMGYFGTFSAVVNSKSDEIAQFFKNYYGENIGLKSDNENKSDVLVYARENNWVVIKWPRTYFLYRKTSKEISNGLETIVSAVNVYDGDFWEHFFFKNGNLIDTFHSAPDYDGRIGRIKMELIDPGNAQLIATELNLDIKTIKPYFNRDESKEVRYSKAFPDDMYELFHGQVFIDFWDKLGIWLPEEDVLPEYAFDFKGDFLVEENIRYFEDSYF